MPSSWMKSREFFSDQMLHLCLHQIINFFGRGLGAGFKIGGWLSTFGGTEWIFGGVIITNIFTSRWWQYAARRRRGSSLERPELLDCFSFLPWYLASVSVSVSVPVSVSVFVFVFLISQKKCNWSYKDEDAFAIYCIHKNKSRLAELLAGFRGKIPKRLRHRRCFSQSNIILLL